MTLNIQINGQAGTAPDGASVYDLLVKLGVQDKRVALERNGAIVPKSLHASTLVADGDIFEIITAVGGG